MEAGLTQLATVKGKLPEPGVSHTLQESGEKGSLQAQQRVEFSLSGETK